MMKFERHDKVLVEFTGGYALAFITQTGTLGRGMDLYYCDFYTQWHLNGWYKPDRLVTIPKGATSEQLRAIENILG